MPKRFTSRDRAACRDLLDAFGDTLFSTRRASLDYVALSHLRHIGLLRTMHAHGRAYARLTGAGKLAARLATD